MIMNDSYPLRLPLLPLVLLLAGCGGGPSPETTKAGVPPTSQTPAQQTQDAIIQPELIVDGLVNPSGVAVQPGTGHVFVTMKGRIGRIVPGPDAACTDEVVGFTVDTYGKGPIYELGPLGAAFLDAGTLVVGGGELPDGKEVVHMYAVGTEPAAVPKQADAALKVAGPIPPGADSVKGEGNFYGIAVKGKKIFVTCNGDDTKGWVSTIAWDADAASPLPLTPTIKTKVATGVDAPTGIAIGPDGELVISQLGEITPDADSLLTLYDADSGTLTRQLKTGLYDLCGVAYSPTTGKLYGVDFSWADPTKGGLYRIDVEPSGDSVRLTRVAKLDRPTALAFAPDGTLYVSTIGAAVQGGDPGQVIAFTGL
jgi:DNA-binding beta-propeller fold protein YncE